MQNNNNKTSLVNAQLISLPNWLLLSLFVAPLIIALIIYINWNNIYIRKNKGLLVSPSFGVQFQTHFDMQDSLININKNQKYWNIVYLSPKVCTKSCQQRKANLAKMYQQLSNKQNNIQLFATSTPLVTMQNSSKYQALILKENNLLITDPNNQVIMYYEPNTTTSIILKDMKILFATSN